LRVEDAGKGVGTGDSGGSKTRSRGKKEEEWGPVTNIGSILAMGEAWIKQETQRNGGGVRIRPVTLTERILTTITRSHIFKTVVEHVEQQSRKGEGWKNARTSRNEFKPPHGKGRQRARIEMRESGLKKKGGGTFS